MWFQNLLKSVSPPFDVTLSRLLLKNVHNADLYLAVAVVFLTALAFLQLHLFARPLPVPSKRLPRRPVLQLNFKPDDITPVAVSSSASSSKISNRRASPLTGAFGERNHSTGLPPSGHRPPPPGADGSVSSYLPGASLHGRSKTDFSIDNGGRVTHSAERFGAEFPLLHSHDLPDSFAPLLSSSQ